MHADRDEWDRYGDNDPKEPEIVDVVAFHGSRVTGCGKANPEIAEKQRDLRSSMPGGGLYAATITNSPVESATDRCRC